jgi:hypothetical protein
MHHPFTITLIHTHRLFVSLTDWQYPESFPWNKANYFQSGIGEYNVVSHAKIVNFATHSLYVLVVPYGETVVVGPWHLSVKITPNAELKKVFNTWEEFMSGSFQYCINVPLEGGKKPMPLETVDSFTKFSRPASWKGTDLRIQGTLPLLGPSKTVLSRWNEHTATTTATVFMELRKNRK